MAKNKRYTQYDMLEEKGVFDLNPANPSGRDSDGNSTYKGPVEYPKMFYHPQAEEEIIVEGELTDTLRGVQLLCQQKAIKHKIAYNLGDEKLLRQQGWQDHPAKSLAAAGKVAPMFTEKSRIGELEAELSKLRLEREDSKPELPAHLAEMKKAADASLTGKK